MKVKDEETPDKRLIDPVRSELEKRWLERNQDAIADYNRRVAEHGLLSDEVSDEDPLMA
jgi:post-segregation antitoxin (ccd killing protein)